MKAAIAPSLVLSLLVLDFASFVAGRRNGTTSLARKRYHKRSCKTSSLPVPTSTNPPLQATLTFSSSTMEEPQATRTATASPTASPTGNSGLVKSDFMCDGQPSGATLEISETVGPNGSQDWLDCGLSTSPEGWNPPPLTMDDIVYRSLEDVLGDDNSPFAACKDYLDLFNKHAQNLNVPAIFIASFALQESSCNPNTVGGAGEQGMMQITPDKCHPPDGVSCLDADYNIGVGSKYFADTLAEMNGNVLTAVGRYNGWYPTLTEEKVRSVKGSCCWCQQNMDYHMQFFNGWIQGKDAYAMKLGHYRNYGDC